MVTDPVSEDVRPGVLLELATLIADRQSLSSVFRAFGERLLAGTVFDFASLARWNRVSNRFETIADFPEELVVPDAPRSFRDVEMKPWSLKRMAQGVAYEPAKAGISAGEMLHRYGMRQAWSMPLMGDDGEVEAILTVARTTNSRFNEQEQEFLRTAGQLLTSAVREETRVDEARAEAERSHLLSELSLLLNEQQTVTELFERATEVLTRALDCEFVMLAVEGGGEAEAIRTWPGGSPLEHHAFVQQAKHLLAQHGSEEDGGDGLKRAFDERGLCSHRIIRLHDKGESLGVLVFAGRDLRHWGESSFRFMELAGRLISQSLAWERRYRASVEEVKTQRVLASIMAAAARETETSGLLAAIQAELSPIIPLPVVLFGFEDDRTVTYILPDGGRVERSFRIDSEQETYFSLPAELRGSRRIRALGTGTLSVTAVRAGGTTIGYLLVGTAAEAEATTFGEAQLALLRVVAQLIGPVLQQARVASAESQERSLLRLALGSMSEGIVLFDKELRPAYHNTLGGKLIELAREGAPGGEVWGAKMPAAISIQQRTTAVYGVPTDGRSTITIDGNERCIDYAFVPVDHPDYRLMWVARDATEEVDLAAREEEHREEMERAARLAALGSIVGGVAHELNNPLTAILGFSEILVETVPEGALRDDLRVIHKEADRAKRIVSDLQVVGRSGLLDRAEFGVASVIGHIERVRRPEWVRRGIAVQFENAEPELRAWGSEDRITQVLLNLVTNAEDAVSEVEGPAISISAYEDADMAVVEVRDNGMGMDAATRRRIFEPFFTTKKGTGTGLGLSVSYSIVAAHGGAVEVESSPGAGSCFRVRLPLRGQGGDACEKEATADHARAMRVLLIDDEPNVRKVGQRLVQSLGHECSVADGPDSAAALVAADDFDVVLCDYRLGNQSADDVIAAFEESNPGMVSRTVLATGAMNDDGVQQLLAQHNLGLLPKPYGAEELGDLLRSYQPVG